MDGRRSETKMPIVTTTDRPAANFRAAIAMPSPMRRCGAVSGFSRG
jgi:hypothetical protein